MFGVPGGMQLVILLLIILLLFGKRIPQMMGSLGQGVVEFKKGINGIDDEKPEADSKEKAKEKETADTKD